MKNVLLIGGAGFIGSHVADRLIDEGHKVLAVDNLLLGKEDNLSHLMPHPRFSFIKTDFSCLNNVIDIFSLNRFDVVFHFAANSDIQASETDPARDLENTFMTTANTLEAMRRFGVQEIVFPSSSAIYGEKIGSLIKEETGWLFPLSYYGGAKLASEAFISAYCFMNDMKCWIFRFPNVVGERATHGVIHDFINKLNNNPTKLTILGNGQQSKPYLYVHDLINAIFYLWQNNNETINCFNIGVETITSVNTIADIVCAQMGLPQVHYEYTGGSVGWKGDIREFRYDLSAIKAAGWQAQYSSNEAVLLAVKGILGT